MPITFQRSSGQHMTKSPCAARNRFVPSGRPAFGIIGVVPVWGFGEFDASSAFGSLVYKEVWPFVFNKLTETWSESWGWSRTKTTEFSQFVDIYQTITDSGGTPTFHDVISSSVTATSITITYWCDAYHVYSGTYTATLSDRFSPGSVTDGWKSRAIQSSTLCGKLNINDIPQDLWAWYFLAPPAELWGSFNIYPVSYGTGWSVGSAQYANPGINRILSLYEGGYSTQSGDTLLAAAYGMGARPADSGSGSELLTGTLCPFEPSIFDNLSLEQLAITEGTLKKNHGAIITAKFGWALSGTAQANNPNQNNHLTLYKQSVHFFTQDNSPFLTNIVQATSMPSGVTNPVAAGTYVEFNPQDVYNNCYHATDNPEGYGVLGFVEPTPIPNPSRIPNPTLTPPLQ